MQLCSAGADGLGVMPSKWIFGFGVSSNQLFLTFVVWSWRGVTYARRCGC